MKYRTLASVLAGTGLALCLAAGEPANAGPPVAGYVGQAQPSVSGCPWMAWRLAKHNDGTVTGIAYYLDASGVSMVRGNIDPAGNFRLTLTSSMGNGPVGTVVGKKMADGSAVADLTGEGCANMHVSMQPAADLATQFRLGG